MTNKTALITGITGQDGAYLAEFARAQNASIAWKGALAAAKAALITMGIELFAALVAAGTWLGGALAF